MLSEENTSSRLEFILSAKEQNLSPVHGLNFLVIIRKRWLIRKTHNLFASSLADDVCALYIDSCSKKQLLPLASAYKYYTMAREREKNKYTRHSQIGVCGVLRIWLRRRVWQFEAFALTSYCLFVLSRSRVRTHNARRLSLFATRWPSRWRQHKFRTRRRIVCVMCAVWEYEYKKALLGRAEGSIFCLKWWTVLALTNLSERWRHWYV